MSARKVRPGSGTESAELTDRSAFVGMFDAHAAHLYDYCLSLLGDGAEAASAARVTLIAGYMLGGRMNEPGRLRAWMFALARRECLSDSPTRKEPWAIKAERPVRAASSDSAAAIAEAETGEIPRIETHTGFEAEIRRAVRLVPRNLAPRPDQYREVLDLVHRHGIAPSELPAILDISADRAQDLLAAAPVMASLNSARASTETRRTAGLPGESLSGGPLASLPGSVWRETASVVFDAEQRSYRQAIAADAGRLWADGFPPEPAATKPPSHKRMAVTSVGLAAALLAPAALGAGLYAIFANSPHNVSRSHEYAVAPDATTRPAPSPGTSSTSTAAHTARPGQHRKPHGKARPTVASLAPPLSGPVVPPPTTRPSHKPTSSPPVINPGPSKTVRPSPSPSKSSPSPGHTSTSPTPPTPSAGSSG